MINHYYFTSLIIAINVGIPNTIAPKVTLIKKIFFSSKRFIKTGNGGLKYAHAGKKHLNRCKGKVRLTSLGARGHLQGTWLKKMKRIL